MVGVFLLMVEIVLLSPFRKGMCHSPAKPAVNFAPLCFNGGVGVG
jgi:hypothetical protein